MTPFPHAADTELGIFFDTGEDGMARGYFRVYCRRCDSLAWYEYFDMGWIVLPSHGELEANYQSMIQNAGSTSETH